MAIAFVAELLSFSLLHATTTTRKLTTATLPISTRSIESNPGNLNLYRHSVGLVMVGVISCGFAMIAVK